MSHLSPKPRLPRDDEAEKKTIKAKPKSKTRQGGSTATNTCCSGDEACSCGCSPVEK